MKLKLFRPVFSIALLLMTFTSPAYGDCNSGNCYNGYGTYTDSDGLKYVGEWKNGKQHGQGTYTNPDGTKYVGEWKNGKEHGQGTKTNPDRSKYVGEWKNGELHGQGTATWPDGLKYVGEWKNGKRHGQGTNTNPDGIKYVGEWKNGEPHGQGTYTNPDGTKYVGELKNGKEHGQGTATWPDGGKHLGEWKDGIKNGQGTMTYADGTTWAGEWRDGKKYKENEKPDTTPPIITITSHQPQRGIVVIENSQWATIRGQATDDNGIASVYVNGETANVSPDGRFSARVSLNSGINKVWVQAYDNKKNVANKNFEIERPVTTASVQPPKANNSSTTASVHPPQQTDSSSGLNFGNYHALIIGNNNYKHLTPLQTAIADAEEVERILKNSYGFQTKLLIDATRRDIMLGMNEMRSQLGENDNLLIYYAGHGEFDKSAQKAYWLPVDAESDNDADWIIVDSITSNIKRISSKHVLIVADSCYSGTLTRKATTSLSSKLEREKYFKKMLRKTSRTLMASGGNEPVSDSGGKGHSIFADVFLEGLKTIDEQYFTAEQLFYGKIKESVAGRSDQTPEYSTVRNSGHSGGDFIFRRLD